MSTPLALEQIVDRVTAGERLSADEIGQVARTADVLSLGMMADAVRRRLHGTEVTYVRVAACPFDAPAVDIAAEAQEIRLTGQPGSRGVALSAVERAAAVAAGRLVSGFSWDTVVHLAQADGVQPMTVLVELRAAGLEAIADIPVGSAGSVETAIDVLLGAGFSQLCLTCGEPAADRASLALQVAALQDRCNAIRAFSPLSNVARTSGPSTGYDDVKAVAVARLAAPNVSSIQVDWQRYGPKLAQVALTFGADDLDGVPAADDETLGRRRGLLAEVRCNIEAAALVPVERDGRFNRLA